MIDLTTESFETEVLQAEGKVLVDFYATWCGPCKMLAPVLHELEADYEGKVKFTRADTDNTTDIALKYGVSAIPTVILFENGEEVSRFVGFETRENIEEFLAY